MKARNESEARSATKAVPYRVIRNAFRLAVARIGKERRFNDETREKRKSEGTRENRRAGRADGICD